MVGVLLMRGMLVGALAGLLCFAFLKAVGEPSLERAIAFEAAANHGQAPTHSHDAQGAADHHHEHEAAGEELVSRAVQSGLGLFIGVVVYSAAFGGLVAVAFAFV